jgi:hypothetical protein
LIQRRIPRRIVSSYDSREQGVYRQFAICETYRTKPFFLIVKIAKKKSCKTGFGKNPRASHFVTFNHLQVGWRVHFAPCLCLGCCDLAMWRPHSVQVGPARLAGAYGSARTRPHSIATARAPSQRPAATTGRQQWLEQRMHLWRQR